MTLKETIERLAREVALQQRRDANDYAAKRTNDIPRALEHYISDALIAILTDPRIGFKEALETIGTVIDANDCEWAQKKLKELEGLSK